MLNASTNILPRSYVYRRIEKEEQEQLMVLKCETSSILFVLLCFMDTEFSKPVNNEKLKLKRDTGLLTGVNSDMETIRFIRILISISVSCV
jgi:hypothetical protein